MTGVGRDSEGEPVPFVLEAEELDSLKITAMCQRPEVTFRGGIPPARDQGHPGLKGGVWVEPGTPKVSGGLQEGGMRVLG